MHARSISRVRSTCNSVLLAVGCLLTADTAANVMAAAAPRSASPETLLARSSSPAAPQPSRADRQVILERNLFGSLPEPMQPPQPEAPERSRLPVTLIGTFAASEPSLSHATLYDRGRKETFVVGVGDRIEDRAVVVHVERRRIVLREDGVARELTLDADQAASAPSRVAPTARSGRPAPAAPGDPLQHPADPRLEATLSYVERTILDSMVGQARVLPKMEDGHLVGLDVSAIQEGSRFEEMGIEEGDVVTQFNGISIDSPAKALQAAREMLGADGYHVVTRRDDNLKHFHGRWDGTGS